MEPKLLENCAVKESSSASLFAFATDAFPKSSKVPTTITRHNLVIYGMKKFLAGDGLGMIDIEKVFLNRRGCSKLAQSLSYAMRDGLTIVASVVDIITNHCYCEKSSHLSVGQPRCSWAFQLD